MPGLFDFLSGAVGGLFGGGDNTDPFAAVDQTDYSSLFGDTSGITDFGVNPFSGVDASSLFGGTSNVADLFGLGGVPMDLINSGLDGFGGGLTPGGGTPDMSGFTPSNPNPFGLGGFTPLNVLTSGPPNNSVDPTKIGGGVVPGTQPGGIPNLNTLTPGVPQGRLIPPGGGVTGGGNGGNGGLLGNGGGILGSGINLAQLLAAGGGLAGIFGSKQGLGPAADALNVQAKNNTDLVNNQIMPTALANQQGLINGQALSAIDRRLQQSEAAMRNRYAQMGESGSTMEAEDLAGLRQSAQDQVFAEGQQMATTGLQEAATLSNQDASIYEQLMNAQIAQDAALQQAIARVAAAFAGGGPAAAGASA